MTEKRTPEQIGWQDIRLICGEGKLTNDDVLKAANIIMAQRIRSADEASTERAAMIVQRSADAFDALLERGKGTHGEPDYVRDETWAGWIRTVSETRKLAEEIRSYSENPK